jgi:hypothetical protein
MSRRVPSWSLLKDGTKYYRKSYETDIRLTFAKAREVQQQYMRSASSAAKRPAR